MFFFFQAEDGIRDRTVTGVQTCALPIYGRHRRGAARRRLRDFSRRNLRPRDQDRGAWRIPGGRSEERRVGKECRSRWAAEHSKKKEDKTQKALSMNKRSLQQARTDANPY